MKPNELNFDTSVKKRAVFYRQFLDSSFGKLLKFICVAFLLLSSISYLYGLVFDSPNAIIQLLFAISLIIASWLLFITNYTNIRSKALTNLADWLVLDIHIAYEQARLHQSPLTRFYTKLFESVEGHFFGARLNWPHSELIAQIENAEKKGLTFEMLFDLGWEVAQAQNQTEISTEDLIIPLVRDTDFEAWLSSQGQNKQDVLDVYHWLKKEKQKESLKFNRQLKKMAIEPLAKEWSSGYTTVLSRFATERNAYVARNYAYYNIYHRENEINQLEDALSASRTTNALLLGAKGVGKSVVVDGLVKRIIDNSISPQLRQKRVFSMQAANIFNGVDNNAQAQQRLAKLLDNLNSYGNGVLYIEDIHNFFDRSQSRVGAADMSEVLVPYLTSSLQIIGSTNHQDFHASIAKNSNITALFQPITITEPDDQASVEILQDNAKIFEYKHKVLFTQLALKRVVEVAKRYIQNNPMPEKALKLLESVALNALKNGNVMIEARTVDETISALLNVQLGDTSTAEADTLNNLEEAMHRQIIGQEKAITAISNALRRSRAGLTKGKRPVGSFLFLGPTGVGKTETAKALARIYFKNEAAIVRLDMSEYQELSAISKLIGENGSGGYLTDAINANPFSLILLEELEKANKDLLNIFLQVLEDGRLTDGLGRTINFTNTIIIATSNAGSEMIQKVPSSNSNRDKLIIEHIVKSGIFRPEFVNRFDATVVFDSLTAIQIKEVVKIMLADIVQELAKKQIKIEFSEELIAKIAQKGYDPTFGARPLRRYIQDNVESVIATKIINKQIGSGSTITLDAQDIA